MIKYRPSDVRCWNFMLWMEITDELCRMVYYWFLLNDCVQYLRTLRGKNNMAADTSFYSLLTPGNFIIDILYIDILNHKQNLMRSLMHAQ